jgi:hypothetical protein
VGSDYGFWLPIWVINRCHESSEIQASYMYCRPKVIKAEWNDAFGIFSVPVIYTACTELYFNFYYYNNKIITTT